MIDRDKVSAARNSLIRALNETLSDALNNDSVRNAIIYAAVALAELNEADPEAARRAELVTAGKSRA